MPACAAHGTLARAGLTWEDRGVDDPGGGPADELEAQLADIADELYALPADGFVPARDARAKQLRADGRRDLARTVAALPRPTVAAWLLNQLSRRRTEAVEQLVDLGAQFRTAQDSLDGEQLRALTRQRQQVVRAFSRQVAELGDELGRPVSSAVAEQVEETLRAAVADEAAGQALLSGRLTTALSYVGMGSGSVSTAVAVPRTGPAVRKAREPSVRTDGGGRRAARRGGKERADPEDQDGPAQRDELAAARERRQDEARAAVEAAEDTAAHAVSALEERDEQLSGVAERISALQDRLDALRAEVVQLEAEVAGAEAERDDLRVRRDRAQQALCGAREDVARARSALADVDGVDDVEER